MRIQYHTAGAEGGETILFIHGGGLSGTMWAEVASNLENYHCLIPDLPQHGLSKEVKPLTLEHCIEQLAGLIEENTEQGQAHIVGLSLGGAIALTLLQRKPHLVKSMIVSGTATRINKFMALANNLNAPLYKYLSAEKLAKFMIKGFQIPEKFTDLLTQDARVLTPATIKETTQILTEIDLPVDNKCPLLVLVGEKENRVARSAGKRISSLVPQAQSFIVPEVGHAWSYQKPELFAAVIDQWIKGNVHQELKSLS